MNCGSATQRTSANFFVVGWGYGKLIPVEDNFSRKIIEHDVRPDTVFNRTA